MKYKVGMRVYVRQETQHGIVIGSTGTITAIEDDKYIVLLDSILVNREFYENQLTMEG